jgi:hypothetical protein
MPDLTHPSGWWLASDGNWYPPHLHPEAVGPPEPPVEPPVEDPGSAWPPPGAPPSGHFPEFPEFPQLRPFPPFAPFPPSAPPGPTTAPPMAYGYAGPPYPPSLDVAPGYGYPAAAVKTNGLAIASLILSILSLVGIGSIVGIILGFVSRTQIRQSHGTQRGAGMGLAGIIVGFVTLTLVVVAVAIPTFLGVEASTAPVLRLTPTPIALGTPQQGGSAAPMPWVPKSGMVYNAVTTLTPVPGGVDMAIGGTGHAEYAGAPVLQPFPSIQESASVAIVAGPSTNGIGLGCRSLDQSTQLAFFVRGSGQWQIIEFSARSNSVVDSGASPAIHPVGSNAVTIACRDDLARSGTTQLTTEVNGTPVADDLLRIDSAEWVPTIQLCSCDGPDTGQFLDVAYYSSPDTPATST